MALPKIYVGIGLAIALAVVVAVGFLVLQPPGDLVQSMDLSSSRLTPNADGSDDIVVISYRLARSARVSIRFENQDTGQVFDFREQERRVAGDYSVNFSGVVEGYELENDTLFGAEIERRLIPDGTYTWTFIAENDDDGQIFRSGQLIVEGGDTELPLMSAFEVNPRLFTPNQDGLSDRISVNVYLEKDADLLVFLEDQDGARIYLAERALDRQPGERGNHEFDYDGGVDDGFEPPEDGTYTLFAVAQDEVGQRVVRTTEIEIMNGGLPQAEIAPQATGATVCFYQLAWDDRYLNRKKLEKDLRIALGGDCSSLGRIVLQQGDFLAFKLTVENYGETPLRTQGPFAGTVYDYVQLPPALGFPENDGALRVGIHCQSSTVDHPWRWALGKPENLSTVQEGEETFYYLEPGDLAQVWGAIRMTEIIEERNPQDCYASLIHEGVRVFNQQVGTREIEILPLNLGS